MSWFDEQIKQRKLNDNAEIEEGFLSIADAVLGSKRHSQFASDDTKAQDAIEEILMYYHVKSREIPPAIKGVEERLEFLLRPNGIMRRRIILETGWYKNAVGAMLAVRSDDGTVVALIPKGFGGYVFYDSKKGCWEKLSQKNENVFQQEAICFYKPFPLKKMNVVSLIRYMMSCLSLGDIALFLGMALSVSLVGLLGPMLNHFLFEDVIESQSIQLLWGIAIFIISVTVSKVIFTIAQKLVLHKINMKVELSVQAACMMRILMLPAEFFKNYSSGELANRTFYLQELCSALINTVMNIGISSLFSLIYIFQIVNYTPELAASAIGVVCVTIIFVLITIFYQSYITKQQMEVAAKESGMSYSLISGIQKIKLAGAEKRAFARWTKLYAKNVELLYNPPIFLKANGAFSTMISLLGTLLIYITALNSSISVADYYTFYAAYGMLTGAFMALAGISGVIACLKPAVDMVRPILETVPEVSEEKQVIERISGGIELNNISFRYHANMPLVIDNLSLKIRPGQYVAIVGETGCGKSTLMRLLLGFEKPQKGAIYYDGKDLSRIDLKSLRKKIGVVMQEGKLFQGDIFHNIIISAPHLTLDDAWEAAELAGVADEIRKMPMGMHTLISEGNGGISGGQRQRLIIARAVVAKPKILMFDEATSALDNITQKKISDALKSLKCTRIVIAHRLSTIQNCDRILYLENGKIVEDGTYEHLISLNGKFADLVARQRVDV